MDIEMNTKIKIQPVLVSRAAEFEGKSAPFGRVFSDHMYVADYEQGKWKDFRIVPYEKMALEPSCLVFHYGQAIFEGMKAYKGDNDEVYLFRPELNIRRFNHSAERMCMPAFQEVDFMDALKELVSLDKNWIPKGEGNSLYIRPFMIATDEYLGVKASEKYRFIIITSPVGSYYADPVKVKIETSYTRAVVGGTGQAKSAGNYAGTLYPAKLANEKGYHQLLWTDAAEHKYFEESGTMNVMFLLKGNRLLTPTLSTGTILNGVTRDSVLRVAKHWGLTVEERKVSVQEIVEAMEKGDLLEAFGTGTAATIAHIAQVGYEGKDFTLPVLTSESFTKKLLVYMDVLRRGVGEDPFNWRIKVG